MTQFVHYIPHEADDKLNAYQMRLYGHYIRIKSTDEPLATSAKICQMSIGMVSKVRKELAEMGFIQIDTDESGYVYLLEASIGLYKIGMAKDVTKRLGAFSGMPFEVSLICSIPCHNMRHLEKSLHFHFASKWVRGEWFALSPDDVEYIKSLAVQA